MSPRRGERALRLAAPGSLFDHREDSLRALVRLTSTSSDAFLERLRRAHGELADPVSVGVSSVCQGEAAFADGFAEAQQALVGTVVLSGTPTVLAYDEANRKNRFKKNDLILMLAIGAGFVWGSALYRV